MRRLPLFLAFFAALSLAPGTSRAADTELEIDLLIMGPGDHLYTRGGHAAVMVAEIEDGELVRSTVYNYGDTDWDDPLLVPHFLRGNLTFFLSDTGSIQTTLEEYGVRQGREITRQRLNLQPDQAAEVARRLREGVVPGKREYTFHHMHALCSTRIMDVLDDVLDGKLRAQLAGRPGPDTGRHYQDLIFSESLAAQIGGDLFLGRLHDRVLDKYESTASPEHMGDYLQQIMVPASPGSARMVPLAEPPVQLVARKEPLILHKTWLSQGLWGALIAALAGFGAAARRRVSTAPERAANVVFWSSLVSGVIGTLMLGFLVLSRVPEFRWNELILVFWPTDLLLAWRARRAAKQGASLGAWTGTYANVRLGVAALAVFGHLAGVLIQEPRILVGLGFVEACVLWTLVRALRPQPVSAPSPSPEPAAVASLDTTPAPSP